MNNRFKITSIENKMKENSLKYLVVYIISSQMQQSEELIIWELQILLSKRKTKTVLLVIIKNDLNALNWIDKIALKLDSTQI